MKFGKISRKELIKLKHEFKDSPYWTNYQLRRYMTKYTKKANDYRTIVKHYEKYKEQIDSIIEEN